MVWFSHINHVDAPGVSITSNSEELSMLASKLGSRQISDIWRSKASTAYFEIDFGADVLIDVLAIAVLRNNDPKKTWVEPLAATDTIQHLLDADGGTPGTGAAYDSGAINTNIAPGYGYHTHIPSAQKTARYWRGNIVGTSRVALGYFDIGRAWAGAMFRPSINYAPGFLEEWGDDGLITRANRSRAEFVSRGGRVRQWSMSMTGIYDNERQSMLDLERQAGVSDQVLIGQTETGDISKDVMLARLNQITGLSQLISRSRKTMKWVESR